jgi:hypothetical protein
MYSYPPQEFRVQWQLSRRTFSRLSIAPKSPFFPNSAHTVYVRYSWCAHTDLFLGLPIRGYCGGAHWNGPVAFWVRARLSSSAPGVWWVFFWYYPSIELAQLGLEWRHYVTGNGIISPTNRRHFNSQGAGASQPNYRLLRRFRRVQCWVSLRKKTLTFQSIWLRSGTHRASIRNWTISWPIILSVLVPANLQTMFASLAEALIISHRVTKRANTFFFSFRQSAKPDLISLRFSFVSLL